MQVVIFPSSATVSVVYPQPCGLPIQEIARKDVPFGVPYRIIDAADIPADRTYRDAWSADFSAPDGHGLGPQRWFIEQWTAEIAQLEAAEPPEEKEAAEKFEVERAASIAQLQARIAQMKAEVLEIEKVQL